MCFPFKRPKDKIPHYVRTITLYLIRNVPLKQYNANIGMCFPTCRYPSSYEEFSQSHLPGVYDQEQAGKRMKLPTPETWETQVSLHGNKASTWESLIGEVLGMYHDPTEDYHDPTEDVSWPHRGCMIPPQRMYHDPTEGVSWPRRGCIMTPQRMYHDPTEDVSWPHRRCIMTPQSPQK